MNLRVVGAGLGRTGTHSLKVALEQLLGGPCYHMREVFEHPDHVPTWHAAMHGEPVDWEPIFEGYVATVDWPGCTFWREFSAMNPNAIVLLSQRDSADTWWKSASNTIFNVMGPASPMPSDGNQWLEMARKMMERFSPQWNEEAAAKAAYEAHLASVRAEAPADRLVEWQPSDGWGPLCAALNVAVPDEPFPVTNTTEEWRERWQMSQ
jgi:hypothetical protein